MSLASSSRLVPSSNLVLYPMIQHQQGESWSFRDSHGIARDALHCTQRCYFLSTVLQVRLPSSDCLQLHTSAAEPCRAPVSRSCSSSRDSHACRDAKTVTVRWESNSSTKIWLATNSLVLIWLPSHNRFSSCLPKLRMVVVTLPVPSSGRQQLQSSDFRCCCSSWQPTLVGPSRPE